MFFGAESMSSVLGLKLDDGRRVAVKVRRGEPRLLSCAAGQELAASKGIDCPAILAGPTALEDDSGNWASAEEWRSEGGDAPRSHGAASYTSLLRRLVNSLTDAVSWDFAPPPPWVHYDHAVAGRVFAPAASRQWDPDRRDGVVPSDLREAASQAQARLLAAKLPSVVGHSDLNGLNVRWVPDCARDRPVVHDWDSLAARPEAVLVGVLAVNHVELPGNGAIADIELTEAVIRAYEQLRGVPFTTEELQVAWASGVWVACYNAAFEYLRGEPGNVARRIAQDAPDRLHRAGH